MEPGENTAGKTKRSVERWQKNAMINDDKSGGPIKKRQERKFMIILSREKVVNNFEKVREIGRR